MELINKKVNDILNTEFTAYEMAYPRVKAMDLCYSLGKQFADHFIKVCKEGKDSKNFSHHCMEMQGWWDEIKDIKLKESKKRISYSDLNDWFFTLGKDPEDFIPEEYIELYGKLYLNLLLNRETADIKTIFKKILEKQN